MTGLHRRDLILSAAALALAGTRPARAAGFPEKDITFIIPDSAGGGFDSAVRAIAPAMQKYLPNPVNIVPTNVPGGGGNRGASQIFRAKPDGTTIGIFNIPGLFIQQERTKPGYDLAKFTWIGRVGTDAYAIGVGENSPIKTIDDLRKLSQTRPVKFTSTGPAGTAYTATAIAAHLLGIKAQMITGYKGSSDYVVAAIRGDGDAVVTALPLLLRMQAGKQLRILATFQAHSTVPGVADATSLNQPELAQITLERLVGGPPGMPANIRAILGTALNKALADPAVVDWAKKAGLDLAPESPDQAAATLSDQGKFIAKWQPYLKPS